MIKPLLYTSPKGRAIFPHLTEPDIKYKAEGEYHVKLECDKSESAILIDAIGNIIATEIKKQHDVDPKKQITKAPLPYEIVEDKVIFNFKMKASGKRRSDGKEFTMSPDLRSADMTRFPDDKQIWGDSILRITLNPVGWNMPIGIGCTLRIKHVQVIDLVTGNADNNVGDLKPEVENNLI